MNFTLQTLEELLPEAVKWCRTQDAMILARGVPLDAWESEVARRLGVAQPDQVRLLGVPTMPLPTDLVLRAAAQSLGLASSQSVGMALGYGIFVRDDCWRQRDIVVHELVHSAQSERLGGLDEFLRQYFTECFLHGYARAPLEQEALRRSAEIMQELPRHE